MGKHLVRSGPMRVEVFYTRTGLDSRGVRWGAETLDVYLWDGLPPVSETLAASVFADPVVQRAVTDGPRRRLVSYRLDDPQPMPWGGELLLRDGEPSGQVTSAAWSGTLGAGVGLAYLWRRDGDAVTADHVGTGRYELDVGGRLHVARVGLRPPFDPSNERIR